MLQSTQHSNLIHIVLAQRKISNAHNPKGMTATFIRGIRLPFLFLLLSDPEAIKGSVTASMICPIALIMHIIVITPSIILACGIKSGSPDALEG